MPIKLHKWYFKVFVLPGVSGFAYRFEIYSRQVNLVPDIEASVNVVRLFMIITDKELYIIF